MNYFHIEQAAAYNRERIETELKQMQLEKLARQTQERRKNQLLHLLTRVINWLISIRQQLPKESPTPQAELNLKHPAS